MNLTIGFSPCPNDTFIFDALVNKKIDTGDIQFFPVMEDVQTLNEWAMAGKLDITKLSYGVLPGVIKKYHLLNSGGALGKGVGPLLITKNGVKSTNIEEQLIAIPGENTTAHLLFTLRFPHAMNKIFLRYDAIEDFVLQGKGLGVIIHENRFTYEAKGLEKITDLGEDWELLTKLPIPLGGIVMNRQFDKDLQLKVDALIRQSIVYAYAKYPLLNDYIKLHSQEMSEDVMQQHINLYVNNYSINLGKEGKEAVLKLMDVFCEMHKISINYSDIFVD
jgi:1,4-dihydroxy-6-naphthoate synthase